MYRSIVDAIKNSIYFYLVLRVMMRLSLQSLDNDESSAIVMHEYDVIQMP
jgi:hypothetical protein